MKHINIYILTYYIFFDYFEIQIQYIKYLLIKIAHFIKNKHLYIFTYTLQRKIPNLL